MEKSCQFHLLPSVLLGSGHETRSHVHLLLDSGILRKLNVLYVIFSGLLRLCAQCHGKEKKEKSQLSIHDIKFN